MRKPLVKHLLWGLGVNLPKAAETLSGLSLRLAQRGNGLREMVERLRSIVPDISQQETSESANFNEYFELKRRTLQAFQCSLMVRALDRFGQGRLTVVDVGDSAGTHMLYLRELTRDRFALDTVSVNLDPRAIEKIRARNLKAVQCRAEELVWDEPVDLFTCFEMIEHLHDPALFLRRLAKRADSSRLLMTVPYVRRSRVGLHHVRSGAEKRIYAEDEHIFELSPADWTLLMRHSGWMVVESRVYYQYPRRWPVVSPLLSAYWRMTDFEGFWGALLEKDTRLSDCYQDWGMGVSP
jgi:hypothetical protein